MQKNNVWFFSFTHSDKEPEPQVVEGPADKWTVKSLAHTIGFGNFTLEIDRKATPSEVVNAGILHMESIRATKTQQLCLISISKIN